MVTMPEFKIFLSTVLFNTADSKYVVPLTGNWFIPTIDPKEETATWVGYVILGTQPNTRGFETESRNVRSIKQIIRITAVGPQAEEVINSTLFWDDRYDIKYLLEKMNVQANYAERAIKTETFHQEGFNDTLVWYLDLLVQGFTAVDMEKVRWAEAKPGCLFIPEMPRMIANECNIRMGG